MQRLERLYFEVAPWAKPAETLAANGCFCLDEVLALVMLMVAKLLRRK